MNQPPIYPGECCPDVAAHVAIGREKKENKVSGALRRKEPESIEEIQRLVPIHSFIAAIATRPFRKLPLGRILEIRFGANHLKSQDVARPIDERTAGHSREACPPHHQACLRQYSAPAIQPGAPQG